MGKENFVPPKAACQIPVQFFRVIVYIISVFILADWYFYIFLSIPLVIAGNNIGKIATSKFEDNKYRLIIKIVITILV